MHQKSFKSHNFHSTATAEAINLLSIITFSVIVLQIVSLNHTNSA